MITWCTQTTNASSSFQNQPVQASQTCLRTSGQFPFLCMRCHHFGTKPRLHTARLPAPTGVLHFLHNIWPVSEIQISKDRNPDVLTVELRIQVVHSDLFASTFTFARYMEVPVVNEVIQVLPTSTCAHTTNGIAFLGNDVAVRVVLESQEQ